MALDAVIIGIESEWVPEEGFFWKLRRGEFRAADFGRVLAKFAAIQVKEPLPVRLEAILWYAPVYMQQQAERIKAADAPAYADAMERLTLEVERIWNASNPANSLPD
jgi:hypothetical protein